MRGEKISLALRTRYLLRVDAIGAGRGLERRTGKAARKRHREQDERRTLSAKTAHRHTVTTITRAQAADAIAWEAPDGSAWDPARTHHSQAMSRVRHLPV